MDLNKIKKVYMIGIKGVGMAMLAQYLAKQGIAVSGSDGPEVFMTDEPLKRAGIEVKEKFSASNLPALADLIVYSTAYSAERNEEVAAALAGKTKVLTLPEAMGELFNRKYGIAVCGSHGKTTTAAWLGYALEQGGFSPSVLVGSLVPQFGGLALFGRSDYFVIEADEYQNKFRYFRPQAVLLNNIDWDHPDFFPTPEDYKLAFVELIKKIPVRGFLVANYDDPLIRKIASVNCRGRVVSYAIDEAADYVAYDLKADGEEQYFKVKLAPDGEDNESFSDADLGAFSIRLAGRHNVSNALAVIAACLELSMPLSALRRHLGDFTGTARRMEIIGRFRGALIIDDYAHHPTEIKATLAAARERSPRARLIVVFHPHTYSRTKALLDDFAASFDQADEVIVLDIYGSARETPGGVHSRELVEKIKLKNKKIKVSYVPALSECEEYLRGHIMRDDVVILMGAGDVFRIGQNLLKDYKLKT